MVSHLGCQTDESDGTGCYQIKSPASAASYVSSIDCLHRCLERPVPIAIIGFSVGRNQSDEKLERHTP